MKIAIFIAVLVSAFYSFVIGASDTRHMISVRDGVNLIANELPPSRI